MASNSSDLSLAARLAQFGALVGNCEIRGRNNAAFNLDSGIKAIVDALTRVRESQASVYVIGNGGSAGIAGHATATSSMLRSCAHLRYMTLRC